MIRAERARTLRDARIFRRTQCPRNGQDAFFPHSPPTHQNLHLLFSRQVTELPIRTLVSVYYLATASSSAATAITTLSAASLSPERSWGMLLARGRLPNTFLGGSLHSKVVSKHTGFILCYQRTPNMPKIYTTKSREGRASQQDCCL